MGARTRSTRSTGLALAIGFLIGLAGPASASAATVINGDFETGNLSGWNVSGPASPNNWKPYSGTITPTYGPALGVTVPAPPQGTFGAITEQASPGTRFLYQDVSLEPGVPQTLSLYVYYDSNQGGAIASPNSFDSAAPQANQQYRVDVMKPTAALDSLAPADILLTVFRTVTGDPLQIEPRLVSADLAPFAGQTVRLRFAEVDNSGEMNAAADAVAIKSKADCAAVTPRVSNYTPRNRKPGGARVPGVRGRIRVDEPSLMEVQGSIVYFDEGKKKTVGLGSRTLHSRGVRNIRLPLPDGLANSLPPRTPVILKLQIAATPDDSLTCLAKTRSSTAQLRTHVAMVLARPLQLSR
jgi:hypothetical protein